MHKISQGHLRKMSVKLNIPVAYQLRFDDELIPLNQYLNQKISLSFLGDIHCIQCGRETKKSFQQGFCFPCMRRINECNNCMIHPERCLVETGNCPEDDWAHSQCHAEQVVYLANSSGLKVGITRTTNMPARWIDQGAAQAIPIFQTSNRYQCGLIEVALKKYVADKTNWRTMLKSNVPNIDLMAAKDDLLFQADAELSEILKKYPSDIEQLTDASIVTIQYPVLQYQEKIKSLSFDKTPDISGVLLGIKGQYLLLDVGVLNIRKFGGYLVEFRG